MGAKSGEISFYQFETKRPAFFTKNLTRIYQVSKSRENKTT